MSSRNVLYGRYKITSLLGSGNFGKIYSALDLTTNSPVALKLETKNYSNSLSKEANVYQDLPSDSPYIPTFFSYQEYNDSNILVISLLGKSLESIFEIFNNRFTLKTVLLLTDQMISCVQFLHEHHYIHRDIKPDNFAIGKNPLTSRIYLLDFGLAKQFENPVTNEHYPQERGKHLVGTARYASINAMNGLTQSRRDDLESLAYIWIYFLCGKLPWMGIHSDSQQNKFHWIAEVKEKVSIEELCSGFPSEFANYLTIVRNLQYDEKPPYSDLKALFSKARARLNINDNDKMEWDIQMQVPKPSAITQKCRLRSFTEFHKRNHPISALPFSISPKINPNRPRIYRPSL